MYENTANTALEAGKKLNTISLKAFDQVMALQLHVLDQAFKAGVKQMEVLRDAKGYEDVVKGQVELAEQAAGQFQVNAKKAIELANGTREEVSAWVETSAEFVVEQAKEVTEKATKAASKATK
ncbi:MAG: phasin family protein [Gammaproteobacteria bacterium]|jgi:hypothetical protein|nr:phasin family protein [Gammaproteobacteria bacterium]